jgi:hypothetical protein
MRNHIAEPPRSTLASTITTICLTVLSVVSCIGYQIVADHNRGSILAPDPGDQLLLTFGLLLGAWVLAIAGIAVGVAAARTGRTSGAVALILATAIFIGLFFQQDIGSMFPR